MSKFKKIRNKLGLSQDAIAKELGMTQANVSFYEVANQTVMPEVAGKLIEVAKKYGHKITYNDIYD